MVVRDHGIVRETHLAMRAINRDNTRAGNQLDVALRVELSRPQAELGCFGLA
jgi:hypothetical protein